MKKEIFLEKKFDAVSKESVTVLNADGKKELQRLESVVLHTMRSDFKKYYPYLTDVEKLESLSRKEDSLNRKKKKSKTTDSVPASLKKVSNGDFLEIDPDWLSWSIEKLEYAEKKLKSHLEDVVAAKQAILEDRIDNEIYTLMTHRSEIDTKILEMQNAKNNIFGVAVA